MMKNGNVSPAMRLKRCNRWLGITLLLMLASGIQLEATSGRYPWSVWIHIILGTVLTALSLRHIYLHYRKSNWLSRFAKNRNIVTRVLWWTFLLTVVTGLAATIGWLDGFNHSTLGGVHGKIGFVMVLLGIVHAVRHLRQKHRLRKS